MKPASFSQKLWRFTVDPRLEVSALIEPMHDLIQREMTDSDLGVLLSVQRLVDVDAFSGHASSLKPTASSSPHAKDVGYDLASRAQMVRRRQMACLDPPPRWSR